MNKSKTIVCAIASLSMSFAGAAFAQQDKDNRTNALAHGDTGLSLPRGGRGEPHRDNGDRDNVNRGRPPHQRGSDMREGDRGMRDGDRGMRDRGMTDRGPGAGPDHNFYRGGRLPPEYRSRQYVVDDWRGHRLDAPPRGYHWVQTGGDYVLVAIATGVIASILLNH